MGEQRPQAPSGAADSGGLERSPGRPSVSVVIPCYNYGRFLAEAIASVLGQSYQDFEIVVIDDGSTDDTERVARRFPRVQYHRQGNEGLSAARNAGTRVSRGRYILYHDADDLLTPDALETGVYWLEQRPDCAFVSGDFQYISTSGAAVEIGKSKPASRDHYLALLSGNYIGMPGTVIYRRDAVIAEGGFNVLLNHSADYDLYLRLARRHAVFSHDRVVGLYRRHDANMSANKAQMLRYTLRVLGSQWPYVRHVPRLRRAFYKGIAFWLQAYWRGLIAQAVLPDAYYQKLMEIRRRRREGG